MCSAGCPTLPGFPQAAVARWGAENADTQVQALELKHKSRCLETRRHLHLPNPHSGLEAVWGEGRKRSAAWINLIPPGIAAQKLQTQKEKGITSISGAVPRRWQAPVYLPGSDEQTTRSTVLTARAAGDRPSFTLRCTGLFANGTSCARAARSRAAAAPSCLLPPPPNGYGNTRATCSTWNRFHSIANYGAEEPGRK